MRVQGIGELTNRAAYWQLTYDDCSHGQVFAREGLDDPEAAAFYVQRHYAECLTCAPVNRPVAVETPNVESDQFHLVLNSSELAEIVSALRSSDHPELAQRLEHLRQIEPSARNPGEGRKEQEERPL